MAAYSGCGERDGGLTARGARGPGWRGVGGDVQLAGGRVNGRQAPSGRKWQGSRSSEGATARHPTPSLTAPSSPDPLTGQPIVPANSHQLGPRGTLPAYCLSIPSPMAARPPSSCQCGCLTPPSSPSIGIGPGPFAFPYPSSHLIPVPIIPGINDRDVSLRWIRAYAARTRVPISRTKTDIEELLAKHGVTGCAYATEGDRSLVAFSMFGGRVQIMLLMLSIDDYARTARNARRTAGAQRSV